MCAQILSKWCRFPTCRFACRSYRLFRKCLWLMAFVALIVAGQSCGAAFVQIEVQDWDTEGGVHDLTGSPLFTDNALFNPPIGLGTLGPSGTKGGGFNYLGQSTEWANFHGENAPSIKSYARKFKIPSTYNGFAVTKATLLYDFVFLTDDLNDLGVGQSDLEDDDYFRVHLDGTDILKIDSDQVLVPGSVAGLTPPQTNSDPLENTGYEKRTGKVGNPWLTSSHNVTNKIGKNVDLGFDVVDPVLLNPVGESLESGMMLDEIRLLLFYDNTPSNADFDDSGTVDQTDLLILRENYGQGLDGDADFDEDVDGTDFRLWQRQAASSNSGGLSASAVPEPAAIVLAGICAAMSACRRNQRGEAD